MRWFCRIIIEGMIFLIIFKLFIISEGSGNAAFSTTRNRDIRLSHKSIKSNNLFFPNFFSFIFPHRTVVRAFDRTPRRRSLVLKTLPKNIYYDPVSKVYRRQDLRNIAIVAHVDHGKTTLVDALFRFCFQNTLEKNFGNRVMDSGTQEKTRGITIMSKNTAVTFNDRRINIVDTPGHADFSGEVERVVNMVDGALLVVDAVEGPRPQTRFVLSKMLEAGCNVIVVINKVDRELALPRVALDKTFDLFVELNASDEQTDFKVVYASGLLGYSGPSSTALEPNMAFLLETIESAIPGPPTVADREDSAGRELKYSNDILQMQVANKQANSFKGPMAVGRIRGGSLRRGSHVAVCNRTNPSTLVRGKVEAVSVFEYLNTVEVEEASAGDIVVLSGLPEFQIGDSIVDPKNPVPLNSITIGNPTVQITVGVNRSPIAGLDPKTQFSTGEKLKARLDKELETNVALKVSSTKQGDMVLLSGRGQMHLTVLLEDLRNEGYEFMAGPPQIIEETIDGVVHEPFDIVSIYAASQYTGLILQVLQNRNGKKISLTDTEADGSVCTKYLLPTRCTFGIRAEIMTVSRGTAIIDISFDTYKHAITKKRTKDKGSILSTNSGTVTTRGIIHAQDHGPLYVRAGDVVYPGMIVGISSVPQDLKMNLCRAQKLTNIRAVSKDKPEHINPPLPLTIDSAIEYIGDGEFVEVTPSTIRMAKAIAFKK